MTTKTDTEQERADFEAWLVVSFPGIRIERLEDQRYVSLEAHFMFEAYQAGRAALQSQYCLDDVSHEVWAAAQTSPGEGIEDAVGRIRVILNSCLALQSQGREDVKRPVLDSIVDEIHRRADKEWADDGYDFEVTITADEYKALCEEEKAIDHARRVEGDGE